MKSLLIVLLAISSWPLTSLADEAAGPSEIYVPSDFEQYAPLNARDMVERIPGFRFSNSRDQDESRGLGQATENVLINGQRVSSKSASAEDVLARIPAETVERIELLEGAALDIPGLSGLVVNVVAQATGVSGTWRYRARAIEGQNPRYFGGELAVAGQQGELGWTLNLDLEPRGSAGDGEETLVDANGNLIESAHLIQNNKFPNRNASMALRWTPPSGLIANLNLEYLNERRERQESADRFGLPATMVQQRTLVLNETRSAELGGDIEFDALFGRLKLIGVYADKKNPFTSERDEWDAISGLLTQSRFRQDRDETELIFRGEYNWPALGGAWEASIETAENALDSRSVLLENTGGGTLAPVSIGDTDVSVEESRSEGFLTYSRALGEALQVQVSVGTEVSEIRASGPLNQTRQFTRPKGGLTLSWAYDTDTNVNARIQREVGQLDFFDFVSQIDLNNGEDQVGNLNIVPEQSWRAEVELERQFGDWGAGTMLVFAEALEDIVDQVPIGTGEGPGNIERGSRLGIEFEGTVNFDPVGLSGAQLIYAARLRDSSIDDPLTGDPRAITNDALAELELEFRHDISGTDFAWGGDLTSETVADTFRIDSIRSELEQPGRMSLFVEHKDIFGLTARAEFFRPYGNLEKQTRQRFSPDRAGALLEVERARVQDKPLLILEISGAF